MSAIDAYRHTCLGIVVCPSTFPIVYGNDAHRTIPIYRLDEDALAETSFQGKAGDILLGGGTGESAALRISMPEAFLFYTHDDWNGWATFSEVVKAYWTMTDAYVFGEGYRKLGWSPVKQIESWLAEHILAFLAQHYPADYQRHLGTVPLAENGSICRLPTEEAHVE